MRLRLGLRLKLGLYVVLFVTSVSALVGYLRWQGERQLLIEEVQQRGVTLLRAFAVPCAVAMANNDTPTLDNYVVQFAEAAAQLDLRYLAVLDYQGKVAAHTRASEFGKTLRDPLTEAGMKATEPRFRVDASGGEAVLEVAVPIISGLRWGTLRAGFNLTRLQHELGRREISALLLGILLSMGAAVIAYLVLSRLVVRPVTRMADMARHFGEGNLGARVQLPQRDEMGQLADQLNSMAAQIQNYTDSLERLVEERTEELGKANDQLREANTQLERLARTDGLTGLYNRRHFMEQLQFELRRGQRTAHEFTLMLIDVDHFKHYNDNNGHTAGDELLQRLAALLEINLRSTDVIARYGGEEFIVLLLDTRAEEGFATAQKIRAAVAAQPFPFEESQPLGTLSVSCGVAFYPHDSRDARELIEMADQALYLSKEHGRNTVSRWVDVRSAGKADSAS